MWQNLKKDYQRVQPQGRGRRWGRIGRRGSSGLGSKSDLLLSVSSLLLVSYNVYSVRPQRHEKTTRSNDFCESHRSAWSQGRSDRRECMEDWERSTMLKKWSRKCVCVCLQEVLGECNEIQQVRLLRRDHYCGISLRQADRTYCSSIRSFLTFVRPILSLIHMTNRSMNFLHSPSPQCAFVFGLPN